MQKKRGIQFFFAILIGWMALFCLPAGYAYASQKEADAPLSMDVSYGFDNTAKSDRYLRVTVLLNNDTAPFENAGVSDRAVQSGGVPVFLSVIVGSGGEV